MAYSLQREAHGIFHPKFLIHFKSTMNDQTLSESLVTPCLRGEKPKSLRSFKTTSNPESSILSLMESNIYINVKINPFEIDY